MVVMRGKDVYSMTIGLFLSSFTQKKEVACTWEVSNIQYERKAFLCSVSVIRGSTASGSSVAVVTRVCSSCHGYVAGISQ